MRFNGTEALRKPGGMLVEDDPPVRARSEISTPLNAQRHPVETRVFWIDVAG